MRELQDFPVNATLFNVNSHIVGVAMFQSFFGRVADVILCPGTTFAGVQAPDAMIARPVIE
jgi:hypothetical protein